MSPRASGSAVTPVTGVTVLLRLLGLLRVLRVSLEDSEDWGGTNLSGPRVVEPGTLVPFAVALLSTRTVFGSMPHGRSRAARTPDTESKPPTDTDDVVIEALERTADALRSMERRLQAALQRWASKIGAQGGTIIRGVRVST